MFRGRPKRFRLELSTEESLLTTSPNDLPVAESELIVDIGCETPQINYDAYNGKSYQYFYAISSDVDLDHPGTVSTIGIKIMFIDSILYICTYLYEYKIWTKQHRIY